MIEVRWETHFDSQPEETTHVASFNDDRLLEAVDAYIEVKRQALTPTLTFRARG